MISFGLFKSLTNLAGGIKIPDLRFKKMKTNNKTAHSKKKIKFTIVGVFIIIHHERGMYRSFNFRFFSLPSSTHHHHHHHHHHHQHHHRRNSILFILAILFENKKKFYLLIFDHHKESKRERERERKRESSKQRQPPYLL